MHRKTATCLLIAAALAAAPVLRPQSAHWEPPGGTLPVGEVSALQLVFDDCAPDDKPAPPKVDGLTLEFQGQSTNVSLINGTFSRNVTMSYGVLLTKAEDVRIPEFTVKTNKGPIKVPQARFNAAGATVGSSGVSLGDAAQARLAAQPDSVWAGEVFELKYSIDVAEGYYPSWGRGTFEWDPSPLVAEDWSQPEPFATHGSAGRTGLSYHTRAIAPSPGHVRLNPTSQLINLSVGVTGFGFFQQRQYQQFAVPDSPASIEVRPLPPAPAGFTGAVGEFKIASKVVPRDVKTGEPITWTVELSGTGNWPGIRGLPSREAPREFQVIQPKPKRSQPPGRLFEGTLAEDVVLVPTQPGTFELPALEFVFFDPRSGTYKTVTAPGATVTAAAAAAPAPAAQTPASAGAPQVSLAPPATEAKPPEQPAGGLGDPVARRNSAPEPVRLRSLAAALAAPFLLAGILWSALALRRARLTEPLRPQREARKRLAQTLGAIGAAPTPDKAALLLAWQHDAALLWGVSDAAPAAAALGDPAWATLWDEADRYLYSTDATLPADWDQRALRALGAKTLRPFSPARLLLPRNLFPFLAMAAFLCAPGALAADPMGAYRSGDFPAAEKAFRDQVAADPLDWSARHNLSLALAQQDRWGEAAAQAAASFVQHPGDAATSRQLVLTCDRAGFVPEPLDVLLKPGPLEALARLASPGGWQRAAVASAAGLCAALALFLLASYGLARRAWAAPAAAVLAAVSIIGGAASFAGYRAYGVTADTRAVVIWSPGILRSIPTEADVTQKTTALPAGSTAIADKTFIRWIRLRFPNGQSGWVLRSEATYLWGPPGG